MSEVAAASAEPSLAERIAAVIHDVPDFPEPGVLFKDITPLLRDPSVFGAVNEEWAEHYRGRVDVVAGIEARGFMFGTPLALALGVGFVPVRKAGKLPGDTHEVTYDLEYGSATIEVHTDAVGAGDRVLVVDDVLATGGTAAATAELLERTGASVTAIAVVVELTFLHGRDRLGDHVLDALLTVD